jgi:two-component system nitrogen regulation sensor histidine kinase GlnL
MLCTASQLLDQLVAALIVVDRENVIRFVNTAAERLIGRPRRAILATPLVRLLPGYPVAVELVERAQQHGMPFRARDIRITLTPQRSIPANLVGSPLLDTDGQLVGAVLEIDEISGSGHLEEERHLHLALDSLGSMALAVAHEVKNPLAGIRGLTQLLELACGDRVVRPEEVIDYAALIRGEVDRIARLLDQLLGVTDHRPLNLTALNIHEVLDHVIRIRGGSLPEPQRDYDPSLPLIQGDRDQLVQLFLNLLQNAMTAAGEAGQVRIHTRIGHGARSIHGKRNLSLSVEIVDNGPGIAPALRQKIFLPFFTTREQGTGLGLAIAQRIIRHHDGHLEVESAPGHTVFRVLLPVHREVAP